MCKDDEIKYFNNKALSNHMLSIIANTRFHLCAKAISDFSHLTGK